MRAERFEAMARPDAQIITARALDRFTEMLPSLINWAPQPSTLLLFGGNELKAKFIHLGLKYEDMLIPNSERRFLFVIQLDQ